MKTNLSLILINRLVPVVSVLLIVLHVIGLGWLWPNLY